MVYTNYEMGKYIKDGYNFKILWLTDYKNLLSTYKNVSITWRLNIN